MAKTKQIVLIGHGKIGSGVLSSVEIIYGKLDNVSSVDTYVDSNFNLPETVHEIVEKNSDKDLIVVTDLFGGSVNNEFLKYISRDNFYLITGMNLSLVIELVSQLNISNNKSVDEMIRHTISSTQNSIQYLDEESLKKSNDDDF
ncbi:PTS sugar transporter subunit IIA [Latilactobacillus curvatus]|uniref:PTS sugar transporter subunit IIA n=1 Tax=Latilactobacillus curvatus TaxID=28038 RepID=UPI0020C814F5|nr:PTS mannose transporter subunit IIA [Latilactobacillus curvatus]MCP8863852.1 PTS mannose transporter subunit IIA [Latilactobacillus curvatus]